MLVYSCILLTFTNSKVDLVLNIRQVIFPLFIHFNVTPELIFNFFRDVLDVNFTNFHTLPVIGYTIPAVPAIIENVKAKVLYFITRHIYFGILKFKRMSPIFYIFWYINFNAINRYCGVVCQTLDNYPP